MRGGEILTPDEVYDLAETAMQDLIRRGCMPEVHIPSWVQVVVHSTQGNQAMTTTHNYKTTPNISSASEAGDFAEQFWFQCGDAYRNVINGTMNVDYIEARTLYPQPQNYAGIFYPPQPEPGLQSGDALPYNVAAAIQLKSGVRGRRYRGRVMMPGLSETEVSASNMSAGLIADLAFLAANLMTDIVVGGLVGDPVVASRVGVFLTPVTAAVIDYITDSQRTRLPGRGN